MGIVKRIWEQLVEAGEIDTDAVRGAGYPDVFGYPDEPDTTPSNKVGNDKPF